MKIKLLVISLLLLPVFAFAEGVILELPSKSILVDKPANTPDAIDACRYVPCPRP